MLVQEGKREEGLWFEPDISLASFSCAVEMKVYTYLIGLLIYGLN